MNSIFEKSRKIEIGDRVICQDNGVIGKVVKFSMLTRFVEKTEIKTDDGAYYEAPTSCFAKTILNNKAQ